MTSPVPYEIGFQDNGATYQGFTLRKEPDQFFLHFCYSSKSRKFRNLDTGEMTRRADHFSWHRDGRGHLKIDADNRLQKGQFPDETFLPSKQDSITPLFIISYIKGEGTWEAKRLSSPSSQDFQSIGNFSSWPGFSLVGFLVPPKMPVDHLRNFYVQYDPKRRVLIDTSLINLFAAPIRSIRLPIYPTADVLIILSDLFETAGKKTFGNSPHLAANFAFVDKAIPKLLDQRIKPSE